MKTKIDSMVYLKIQGYHYFNDYLDGGRCFGLKYYLQKYDFKNVIDIGCGTGENSTILIKDILELMTVLNV